MLLKRPIMKENIWLIGVTMADLLSTLWLIGNGLCREVNPIMNYFLQMGWTWFIIVKLLTVAIAVGVSEWYRKHDEEFSRFWVRIAVYAYVGVWTVWFTIANFR